MDFNFNVKIINSFNKKDSFQKKENVFNNGSTLDYTKNIIEVTSASDSSLTNSQESNNVIISKIINKKNNLYIRNEGFSRSMVCVNNQCKKISKDKVEIFEGILPINSTENIIS